MTRSHREGPAQKLTTSVSIAGRLVCFSERATQFGCEPAVPLHSA